jgi:hypothetical protein
MPINPTTNEDQLALIQEFDLKLGKTLASSQSLRVSDSWVTNGVWCVKRTRISNQTVFTCQCCLHRDTGQNQFARIEDHAIDALFPMDAVMERWVKTEHIVESVGIDFVRYVSDGGEIAYIRRDFADSLKLQYVYGDDATTGLWDNPDGSEASIMIVGHREPQSIRIRFADLLQPSDVVPVDPFTADDEIQIDWSPDGATNPVDALLDVRDATAHLGAGTSTVVNALHQAGFLPDATLREMIGAETPDNSELHRMIDAFNNDNGGQIITNHTVQHFEDISSSTDPSRRMVPTTRVTTTTTTNDDASLTHSSPTMTVSALGHTVQVTPFTHDPNERISVDSDGNRVWDVSPESHPNCRSTTVTSLTDRNGDPVRLIVPIEIDAWQSVIPDDIVETIELSDTLFEKLSTSARRFPGQPKLHRVQNVRVVPFIVDDGRGIAGAYRATSEANVNALGGQKIDVGSGLWVCSNSPIIWYSCDPDAIAQQEWVVTHNGNKYPVTFIPDWTEKTHYVVIQHGDGNSTVRHVPLDQLEERTNAAIKTLVERLTAEAFTVD